MGSRREAAERNTPTMQSLCYPYGSGITCVCDRGEIFKCFPDLKSDNVGGGGGLHGQGKAGSGVMVGANTQISDNNSMEDTLDRSTEVVLASTFLILVILIFIAFIIHRCEKTFVHSRRQEGGPECAGLYKQSPATLSSISVSIQTDPQLWSLQQSYTMPLLANGHTSGLLHGTLPRGRLDHVAATCSRYELRQAGGELEVDMISGVKS